MFMGRAFSLRFSVVIFSLYYCECSAQLSREQLSDLSNERLRHDEPPLQCYDCNSEYDSRCADPFNPYTIGVINCSDKKPPENLLDPNLRDGPYPKPTVCRKIVQKIEGRKRIIRECGYIRDDRDDKACILRTGTKNIEVEYCSCTTSLCNSGENVRPLAALFLGFSTLGLYILLL